MRVLLIRPPEYYLQEIVELQRQIHGAVLLPLGILHLGAYISQRLDDVEVQYLDLHLETKLELEKEQDLPSNALNLIQDVVGRTLRDFDPDIVGLSCALSAFGLNLHMVAEIVKQEKPDAVTVAGGHYVGSYPERISEDGNIDHFVLGEGEIPMSRLIRDIREGNPPGKGQIYEREYLDDLDDFPPLDYEAIKLEKYLQFEMSTIGGKQGRSINVLTSRGCPGRCTYCATHNVWDYGFRRQSARRVFEDVVDLKENHGIETVMFVDDNFLLDKPRVKEFCRLLIENGVEINWYPTSVRVNSLDEEMIRLMVQAGCQSMALAVESGSERIQKLIRKRVRLEHAVKMAECMRKEGMKVYSLFVFGFPYETVEEIQQSIEFARAMPCDWHMLNVAIPLKGTEMYETCLEFGCLPESDAIIEMPGVGNISTEEFSPEQIVEIKNDTNYRLNFLENQNYLAGRYEKCLPIFEGVARSYPDHFLCMYMIWKIYGKMGDEEKTAWAYERLCEMHSKNPEAQGALISKYELEVAFR